MAPAKWQQANGAKKCEHGRPKGIRNRQLTKCDNKRKSAKAVENKRTQARKCKNDRAAFVFSAILQFSYICQSVGIPRGGYPPLRDPSHSSTIGQNRQ